MEKVVFFEWRLGEMAAELAAAQSRASAAELERARLAEQRSQAERDAEAARHHVHALEGERERLSSLLARPAHLAAESAAAQAERMRAAGLAAELAEARRELLEEARALWSQRRPGPSADLPGTAPFAHASAPGPGVAATALAEQCLRGLSARDPARREQAARHLAAMPVPAAAPALASALGVELDARARGQMAVALVACGGPAAADRVAGLQSDPEPLVRLSARDALCSLCDRATGALETASRDPSPAVRRRAAAIASALGSEEIRARFAMDADGSVRAATSIRELPAPAQKPAPAAPAPDDVPARSRASAMRAVSVPDEVPVRDLVRDAVLA